jgi:hypothetical protein
MSPPAIKHKEQATRILRYLKGTIDLCITFIGKISTEMSIWQDSSFADGDDMRSRMGFVAMICESVVVWGSRLRSVVTLSIVEAEYMEIFAAAHKFIFLRQLLTNLNIKLIGPTRMLEDNNG